MKKIKQPLLLLSLCSFLYISASAQSTDFKEDQIEELCFGVLNASIDQERKQFNQTLKSVLQEVLKQEGAFSHPFKNVKSLGVLTSADSNLRLFNWMIPYTNGTYDYECFALVKQEGEVNLVELESLTSDSSISETSVYDTQSWPGALYYEIIQKESKLITYYTLLGWDGKDRLINQKLIDVLEIKRDGSISFGAEIFKSNTLNRARRIMFRYGDQNRMKLSYNKDLDWIIFDHLSPSSPNLKGVYEYYGADFSFDAYKWEGNHWRLHSDVDVDKGLQKKKRDFKVDKDEILNEPDVYDPKRTSPPPEPELK
ncbi:MAG: hypothetical protein RIC95_08830 [Vicingaceae bacterium]